MFRNRRKINIDGESFSVGQIHKNSKLQKRLVIDNMEIAINLCKSSGNKSFAKILVGIHKMRNEYDNRVAEIAEQYGLDYLIPLYNPVKQAALDAENNIALERIYRKPTGTKVTSSKRL